MHYHSSDAEETENEISPMVEDSRTCEQNIGYQLDDEKCYDIPDEAIENPNESDSEVNDDGDGDDDDKDADDDILEFINTFDVHCERILYKSYKLTIYEACVEQEIAKIAKRYGNIIREYQNETNIILLGDALNAQKGQHDTVEVIPPAQIYGEESTDIVNKKPKCRGNKKLQRFKRKWRTRGLNEEEIATLINTRSHDTSEQSLNESMMNDEIETFNK
ncbi:unnamed protein product [Rotaria socialis]|uniref:Uncharacterized protein n=1 Tax=Rotaria socialis TaxID=392032 RepID=A0A821GQD4_9BILA|nr:unnamed protein product [Rotaria socialis]